MKRWRIILSWTGVLSFPLFAFPSEPVIVVGNFSTAPPGKALPADWHPLTFRKIAKQTQYTLEREGDTVVVQAVSNASASGLVRAIAIDPRVYPIVQWRWKVSNLLQRSNARRKDGDDYPARLYIAFQADPATESFFDKAKNQAIRLFYGQAPPSAALNYIWASQLPIGTRLPSPYTDQQQMITVESGPARVNQWVSEERNIYEDYQHAFGTDPPLISGVAIMTDTDNTGESATAFYGDIVFKRSD